MSSFSPSHPVTQVHSTTSVGGDGVAPELKHSSIDLSLELERQLELEGSPPRTPTSASTSIHSPPPLPSRHQQSQQQQQQLESLDPQVLAHLVAELRKTIDDMTRERNDLLKLLDSATMREASLQDTLQLMTEKATDYEEELSEAKKKIRQDEDDISLLRHKVEESRRGLMRLQTESRRQSAAAPGPLDLSRASLPGFSGPSTSKRASFTPLTGRSSGANGHRRVSSISVDGSVIPDLSPNPSDSGLAPPSSSRRSLFKYSPPAPENVPLPSVSPLASSPEIEALKREVESLKKELSETRAELSEATEGKEASELCVQALRSFIEENEVGEKGGLQQQQELALKLPPTPLGMSESGEEGSRKNAAATTAASSGWGFKLWKGAAAESTVKAPVVNTTVQPSSSSATSPSSLSSSPPAVVQPTPTASAPFSRLGGFFSSRTSSSSVTTATTNTNTNTNTNATASPSSSLQTNAAITRPPAFQRDSISGRSVSVSDASSVVEPVSPEKENHAGVVKVAVVLEVGDGEVGGDDGVGGGVVESAKKDGMVGGIEAERPSATVIG